MSDKNNVRVVRKSFYSTFRMHFATVIEREKKGKKEWTTILDLVQQNNSELSDLGGGGPLSADHLTVTGTYPQVGTQVKKNITTNPC